MVDVRFSLTLPQIVDHTSSTPYAATFAFARHADVLGFSTGYLGHHSFTPETNDASAPFVVLGAIAAQTEQLRLGTSVYLAPLHHPVTVAEQVQQLDQLSGGRVVLGVGLGYRPYEYQGFGLPFAERGRRLTEMVTFWRHAWATGSYAYQGKLFTVPDLPVVPPCRQQPHPPIRVGGTSPAAIRRAARLGDGWFTLPMEGLDYVRALVDQYRAACRAAGREPYVVLMRQAWAAPTPAAVESEWFESSLAFHRLYWKAGTRGDENDPVLQRVAAGERVPYDEFARGRAIAGTPDFCVEQLLRWHEATAFDEIELMFGRRDPRLLHDAVALFAREVIPAFTAAAGLNLRR
ncbi:MAG: LLM class flavin-dependent oxidoreductase [Dehalococcoidia bacterium]|nr:LLM class flavin-dependent oxidoreductase [Dehalococcoidia bacterium]